MPLAPNLAKRRAMVLAVHPSLVVFSFGDTAHQKEASSHNPDSRGIWHALDIMTETDSAYAGAAAVILAWLLSDVTDLQYVIHDDRIYGRNQAHGWAGEPYQPTNPDRDQHRNHIHVDGLHGSTGKNAATGTGYDTAAEKYTPAVSLIDFMEATMPLTTADIAAIWAYKVPGGETAAGAVADSALRTSTISGIQLPAISAAVAADAKVDAAIQSALAALTAGGTSVDTAAIQAAIKAVGDAESKAVGALSAQLATEQASVGALAAKLDALRTALAAGDTAAAAALAAPTTQ